jgi:hypothetical protein
MSTSQRVSRGFHRLGLFLALSTLLIGSLIAMNLADWTVPFPEKWSLVLTKQTFPQWASSDSSDGPIIDIAGVAKVRMPSNYYDQPVAQQQDLVDGIIANNWRNKFAKPLLRTLATIVAISLALYALVRAIGWVIGGFRAS